MVSVDFVSPAILPACPPGFDETLSQVRLFCNAFEECPESLLVPQQLFGYSCFCAPSDVASFNHCFEVAGCLDFLDVIATLLQVLDYTREDVFGADFKAGFLVGLHDCDDFVGDFYCVV